MVVYVIVYSVILFLLTASAVTLSWLLFRERSENAKKLFDKLSEKENGEKLFSEIFGKNETMVFVAVDSETLQPAYVSENFPVFFGVTADEFYSDVESVKKHIDKKYVREFVSKFSQWDRSERFEQDFVYAESKYAKIEGFDGEFNGKKYVAFAVYDITKERNEQLEMQKALDSALEQAAAKSSFLSSMSHEIRTPMNGVMGMMALAKMNIGDPDKVMNYLDRAGDLSVFLLSMINDILDISKIESGKMQLFNTDTDIVSFADKIRNMFNGTITSKGINFIVETVDIESRYLVVDEMRLTQVVTNLVSNANKFTPPGGKISVTFKQLDTIGQKAQLMIRVRDTGKGIAPENIRKIMRPFEQEEASTARNYGGTGLGLAICDNIVRMMGGNIVIDSTLGKGTDFSVFLSLPVAESAFTADKAVFYAPTDEAAADFTFDGCRILLAEDNEVNAEIAVEILESEGAKVTLARDGREAVEIFAEKAENSFDLLLLDIQMPRLNGRDAAKEIRNFNRSDAKNVPIIALSADAFVEDVKLSEAAGMDGHVSKPVDFDELRKRAGEIIAAKRKSRPQR